MFDDACDRPAEHTEGDSGRPHFTPIATPVAFQRIVAHLNHTRVDRQRLADAAHRFRLARYAPRSDETCVASPLKVRTDVVTMNGAGLWVVKQQQIDVIGL
jgi:hypothetical protein